KINSPKGTAFLAVDDLAINRGECPQQRDTFRCDDNEIIPWDKVCDFVEDCKSGSDESNCGNCDFFSFCTWKPQLNSKTNQAAWSLQPNQVSPHDKTNGRGKFVKLSLLPVQVFLVYEDEHDLISVEMGNSAPSCEIQFCYTTSQYALLSVLVTID